MSSRRRPLPTLGVLAALGLAACGPGSSGTDGAAPATDASLPAATAGGEVFSETDAGSGEDGGAVEPATTEGDVDPAPAGESSAEPEPDAAGEPPSESESEPEMEPESIPAEPASDGDSEPAVEPGPLPAEIGGRVLGAEVRPAANFDGNPFPDLVVNDVGRDGEVNIRNILPSDRPVLLWTWAPH